MLLTLTSTATRADELGYLLHKHPDRVLRRELAGGTATVFYPEAGAERCTAALLLDVDPVALVRRGARQDAFALAEYVNDRPYAAASMLAVAIGRVFGTALAGRCEARPELADTPLPLELRVVAVRTAPELVRRLFEPLGWQVETAGTPLSADGEWGDSPYLEIRLQGRARLADALGQLSVLLPALDGAKHYWAGSDEVDKLLRRGERWLAAHPERELVVRRYLGIRRLVEDATARLAALDDVPPETVQERPDGEGSEDVDEAARPLRLDRRDAVLAALRGTGARRVVDLGCGEGVYLQALAAEPGVEEILGVDVSARELERAERRLERLPERRRERIRLRQSSAGYRDEAIAGYDAMLLVEVVEHLDPERLGSLEGNLFGHAAPGSVIATTPNVEYNVRYGLSAGELRHPDHRFEFTRAEFSQWAHAVAGRHGYRVELRPVGPVDPELGPPTQMAVFTRNEPSAPEARDD